MTMKIKTIGLAIFLIFTLTGIGAARLLWGNPAKVPAVIAAPEPLPEGIDSLILVHVDDLSSGSDPALISVWSMVVNYTDESKAPQVTLKALYPDPFAVDSQKDAPAAFSLNSQGGVTEKFTGWLESQPVVWEGILLFDDSGLNNLSQWLTGQLPELPGSSGQDVFIQEAPLMVALCESTWADRPLGPMPAWSELIPAHFSSDAPFDTLITAWDRLAYASYPPACKVDGISIDLSVR
jgi:hypothetical protein